MNNYEENIYLSQIEELETSLAETEKMWREEKAKVQTAKEIVKTLEATVAELLKLIRYEGAA